jgi:hypothetical protein
MRTANQLRKEITALDLALKMLRAETEGLRRSTITMKKALNAPLALWEEHWFDSLPQAEQDNINRTASLIASALKPAPIINQVTSTTPTTTTVQPIKRTRKPSNATQRNKPWTVADDKKLMRMVKANEPNVHIADVLGRSVSACQQRVNIIKNRKK